MCTDRRQLNRIEGCQLTLGRAIRVAGRGEADYVQALRRAYDDPRIVWLGQVKAEAFWLKVDVLVAPAVWAESFGRSVVEAVQQGRGVIVSAVHYSCKCRTYRARWSNVCPVVGANMCAKVLVSW